MQRFGLCTLGLASLLACTTPRPDRVDAERGVLRALLDSSYGNDSLREVVVRDRFVPFELDAGAAQWLRDSVPELPPAAVEDFKRLAADSSALMPLTIGRGVLRIVPESTLARIFRRGPAPDGWQTFRTTYPRAATGIIALARVGLSTDGTWAVTYVDSQGDWLAGAGYLVVLRRVDGIWHPVKRAMLRIS